MSTISSVATVMAQWWTTRPASPPHQAPVSRAGTSVRTPSLARPFGWRQRLHLRRAARRCASLQRLEDLWDAHHEQVRVWPAGSPQDVVLQQSRPVLRAAIYHLLALC
jgi:hypothetical protein